MKRLLRGFTNLDVFQLTDSFSKLSLDESNPTSSSYIGNNLFTEMMNNSAASSSSSSSLSSGNSSLLRQLTPTSWCVPFMQRFRSPFMELEKHDLSSIIPEDFLNRFHSGGRI